MMVERGEIIRIAEAVLGKLDVTPDSTLLELGAGSLEMAILAARLWEATGVRLAPHEWSGHTSMAEIVDLIGRSGAT